MHSDNNNSTSIDKHPPTTNPSTSNLDPIWEIADESEAPKTPYDQPAFTYDFSRPGAPSAEEETSLRSRFAQLIAQPGDEEPSPPQKERKPRKRRPAQNKIHHSDGVRKTSNPPPDAAWVAANPDVVFFVTRRNDRGDIIHEPRIWFLPHDLHPNEFAETIYDGTWQGVKFEVANGTGLKSSLGRLRSRVPISVVDAALELTTQQFRDQRLAENGCSIQRIHEFVVRFAEVFEFESMVHPTARLVDLAKDAVHALTALCRRFEP